MHLDCHLGAEDMCLQRSDVGRQCVYLNCSVACMKGKR